MLLPSPAEQGYREPKEQNCRRLRLGLSSGRGPSGGEAGGIAVYSVEQATYVRSLLPLYSFRSPTANSSN